MGVNVEVGLTGEELEMQAVAGERLIRAVLLVGFLAVLLVEAWLLWQIMQTGV